MEPITIYRLDNTPPAELATKELKRCLGKMTGRPVKVRVGKTYEPFIPGLWLGLLADFGLQADPSSDPDWDDAVHIRTTGDSGYIAGTNERSILLAAYRYLTELGCRWVRPGKTGECLPALGETLPAVEVKEQASYRHRGVCIEGAVSWEHVRDMVDWLPKLGYNAYFIQFREAYNFFQRWYEHEGNPTYPRREFTVEEARELTARLRAEITRRGLMLHLVGHGWTCEPFGIPGPGWFPHEGPLPEDAIQYLAEIGGKRELWGQIALNTNLCYGNPRTREIVTDAIVEYAQQNPDVDIIHFWLADGSNNQCECPLCRDDRPSDLYVMMLNELDEKLTAAGLETRIVFLAYVDLLWPPQKQRIRNPDRFLLMFAPITRSYSKAFTDVSPEGVKLPPYKRNKLQFPSDPAVNLAFLKAWQKGFHGDGFDFDYHFMWDHFKDPGQFALAEVLHKDIRGLQDIGLNGFMSCQVQRVFFPTGLGMTVLGRTLWDRKLTLNAIARDHLQASFGEHGEAVGKYLRRLSKLFHPRVIRGEASPEELQAALRDWRQIPAVVEQAALMVSEGVKRPEPCQAHSWQLLGEFGEMAKLLSAALVAKQTGSEAEAKAAALALVKWAQKAERRIHHVFDIFEFLLTIGGYLGLSREEMGMRR